VGRRRTLGQGSIYRYADQWHALLRWIGPDGLIITRSKRCRTKPQAEAALAKFRGFRDAGVIENAATTFDMFGRPLEPGPLRDQEHQASDIKNHYDFLGAADGQIAD
jgi:hypothetical protein